MNMWERFNQGPLMGPVAGIAGAIGSAASAASSLGGLSGGSSSAGAAYAQQQQQALMANLERQGIADDYFEGLIGRRTVQRGPRRGETVYGNRGELLLGQRPVDVFGRRPAYREVDFQTMLDQDSGLAGTASDVTEGSIRNFARNSDLADAINSYLTGDAQNRIGAFDPYMMGNIEATGRAAQMASQGLLPSADREGIIGRANERASLYGTPGTSRGQVARDLGLTELDLQTRVAPGLTQANAALINSIAPPQLRADPRASQVNLPQALQIGAADNQFEANFDRQEQSLRSILQSMPDPMAQGLFNLQNTLRAQQFMVDFGLANGYGVPGTMPDNLGGGGMQGFTQAMGGLGSFMNSMGSIFGSSGSYSPSGFGTPGIFG